MSIRPWIAATVGIVLVFASCGGDDNGSGEDEGGARFSGSLTFANFGGATGENVTEIFLDPFAEEEGVEIVDDTMDFAKVYTMVENDNVTWDLVQSDGFFAIQACADGIFEPLSDEVLAAIQEAGLPRSAYGDCHIEPWAYSFALTYNTDRFEEAPDWEDFFNPEIPGGRSFISFAHIAQLEVAALAAGVPRDEIYPIDYDVVFSELNKIKDQIVWTESLTDQVVHVISGRAPMGLVSTSRAFEAVEEEEPIAINWEEEVVIGDTYSVMKGAPNGEAAMAALADFLTESDKLVDFAKATTYGPNGTVAQDALAERLPDCVNIVTCESYLDSAVILSDDWWAENLDEATRRVKELIGA